MSQGFRNSKKAQGAKRRVQGRVGGVLKYRAGGWGGQWLFLLFRKVPLAAVWRGDWGRERGRQEESHTRTGAGLCKQKV